jgi:transglutaminase-like putative cysteine protease
MVSHHIYTNNFIVALILLILALSLIISWSLAEKYNKILKTIGYAGTIAGIALSAHYFTNYASDIGILLVSLSVIVGINISLRERKMLAYLLIFSFLLFLYASSIIYNKYSIISIVLFTFSFLTVVVADYYTSRVKIHTPYNYTKTNHFFGTTFTLLVTVSILTALLYYLLPQPEAIHYGILPFGGKKEYKGVIGEANIKNKAHKERVNDLPSYTKEGKSVQQPALVLDFHKLTKSRYTPNKQEHKSSQIIEKELKEKNKQAYYSSLYNGYENDPDEILFEVKGKDARFLRGETYASFNGKSWKKILTKIYTIQKNSRDYYDYWNGKRWERRTRPFRVNEFYYNEYFTKKSDTYTITIKGKLSGKPIIYTPEGLLRLQFPSDTFYEDAARTIYAPSQLETGTYYTACVESEKYYGYDAMSYAGVWYKKAYSRPGYNLDPRIYEMARKITKTWNNSFEKAQSIVNYFKRNYLYKHSSISHSIQNQTLSEMLFKTKVGNALQFNAALVIMLRSTGEYARLVTGYAPGKYNITSHSYLIQRKDKAVWAEVFVKDRGWVSIHAADDIPFEGEQIEVKENTFLLKKTEMLFLVLFFFLLLMIGLYYSRKSIWKFFAIRRIYKYTKKDDIEFVIATYNELERYYGHFQKGHRPSYTIQEYANYIKTLKPEHSYLMDYLSLYSNQAVYKKELDLDFDRNRYLEAALYLIENSFELVPFKNFVVTEFSNLKNKITFL